MNDAISTFLASCAPADLQAFLEAFTLANPRWRGADAGDVLEHLHETDAHEGLLQAFAAEHPRAWGSPAAPHAVRMALWVDCGGEAWQQTALRLLGVAAG